MKNQPVNYSIFWRPIGFGFCGCFVVACFRHSPGKRKRARRQPKTSFDWADEGVGWNVEIQGLGCPWLLEYFQLSHACLTETVINIRFSQLWLASNLWHFNVLQEITSNTHIHTCTLINTLPPPRHSGTRRKTECQWKSFTPGLTHRNTYKVKPQALCTQGSDRKWLWLTGILNSCYHEGFWWWKGYYPIPPMHWKNESSGIECAVTTLESHM